jgi:hypothetical protein
MKFSSHKHESLLVKATGFIVFCYGYIAYMYVVCTAFFKLTWHLNSCHFYQYPVYFSFTIFYMLFMLAMLAFLLLSGAHITSLSKNSPSNASRLCDIILIQLEAPTPIFAMRMTFLMVLDQ